MSKTGNKIRFVAYQKNPKKGEVWCAKNIEFTDKIGVKSRPIVIKSITGDVIEYYRCTTKCVPGAHRIIDAISAGLYRDTYIIPRVDRIDVKRLAYRYGELSRFDKAAISYLN